MKRVAVRPAAAADIEDAYRWYESQRPGLGDLEHPEAYPVVHRDTRRVLIPERFPYGLFYRLYGDTIIVVARMHAKRDPRRWERRS